LTIGFCRVFLFRTPNMLILNTSNLRSFCHQPLIAVAMFITCPIPAFGTGKFISEKHTVAARYKHPFTLGKANRAVVFHYAAVAGI
jgi:hypothetical protein